MRFYSDSLGLSDREFALLRELIHERTGVAYDDGKSAQLADRLSPRVIECGFNSFLDYYYLLKYDAGAEAEWRRVMDVLAVPETFFWREFAQVQALVNVLVPQHFAARPGQPLHIWSAACAGGEEPLTIAMALQEAGWLDRAPIVISGTDASPEAIARAQAGVYRERAFRALPPDLRRRYFTEVPGGARVSPDLQRPIRWGVANLMMEEEIRPYAQAEMIFCRNVFIYFSAAAMRRVVETFARYMPDGGRLFLGASESLLRVTTSFKLEEVSDAFVYTKS